MNMDDLKREWTVVKRAPVSFVVFTIAAFLVGIYLQSGRIQSRDEALRDYERKLGIVSPNQTVYSVLNNRELKQRTMNAVHGIRSFVGAAEGLAKQDFADHVGATTTRAPSPVEIDASWRTYQPALSLRFTETQTGFAARFKAEAVGCRNELLKRLNHALTEASRALYDSAADRREMAAIADDLNYLAQSLPD